MQSSQVVLLARTIAVPPIHVTKITPTLSRFSWVWRRPHNRAPYMSAHTKALKARLAARLGAKWEPVGK